MESTYIERMKVMETICERKSVAKLDEVRRAYETQLKSLREQAEELDSLRAQLQQAREQLASVATLSGQKKSLSDTTCAIDGKLKLDDNDDEGEEEGMECDNNAVPPRRVGEDFTAQTSFSKSLAEQWAQTDAARLVSVGVDVSSPPLDWQRPHYAIICF